ncbi:Bcr/CflA family efflux MFS transporter [Oecophyllibacter saccharovorans]|uniref:multidrug effflux MFS transporter n=1 Tax=Oecophyllibacter saccharovorans TaxID=2558360 RepID=UPI0011423AB5|nr:multidrug effflux MFS transporter [Oecophyllibacter saccharovorans]QDH14920.1 Bcr/CflA family efflux MFS transporter [Oecophyllibacter saccharovorans]
MAERLPPEDTLSSLSVSGSSDSGGPGPEKGTRKPPHWFPLLLGTLTAVGPVSTDVYLPALPMMEAQLHSPAGSGSLTMTAWVIGLALGQVCVGPLADRFGRRTPLLIGTLGYALASVGCALAQGMGVLCAFRALAAFMGAASLVVPNAIVRDTTSGNASARLMSRLIAVQGVVPIAAPALGGFALAWISWRDIFWLMAVYGLLCMVLVFLLLPETLDADHRQPVQLKRVLERYWRIFNDPTFFYSGMVWILQGFVVFTYLSAAPYLFEQVFHFTPMQYGLLFGGCAICMIGVSQINAVLVERISSQKLLRFCLLLSLGGAVALLCLALAAAWVVHNGGQLGHDWAALLIAAMLAVLAPGGGIGPNAAAAALYHQGRNAGTAAALAGTGQYLTGALASALCAVLPVGTALPMAALFFLATLAMCYCAWKAPREAGTEGSRTP